MEVVEREERMPERMAMPSVPGDVCQRGADCRVLVVHTASKNRQGHWLRAISVVEGAIGNTQSRRHVERETKTAFENRFVSERL